MSRNQESNNSLPNLLIIGAMKAGTSSLHNYLSHHPDIFMSDPKELDFFTGINYSKGIQWYKSHFKSNAPIKGECSPNYSKWDYTVDLIYQHLGNNVKFIYILRDPIKRFLSQCNHMQIEPNLLIQSGEYIKSEIFTNGLYYKRLKAYERKYNPKEHFCIIKLEDLESKPLKVLKQIFSFLGLDYKKYPDDIELKRLHTTSSKKVYATKQSKVINQIRWLAKIKKWIAKIWLGRLIKPLYRKTVYKERIRYSLNDNSVDVLKRSYRDDLIRLKREFHINYFNE